MGTLPGAHTSIRTAAVALWGLRGLDLFLAACSLSGVVVCSGGVVLCAVVRAGVCSCVCALPGLHVARAPCPGVLLRRREDTPSLWWARMAPWRALLEPGSGPVRGSGVCVRRGGSLGSSLLASPPLPLCPFSSACPACLPSSYPLGWPWLDGWSWWSHMVFLSCRAAWVGFVVGGGLLVWCAAPRVRCPGPPGSCSPVCTFGVLCCVCGVLGHLAPVHRCARSVCGVACAVSWAAWLLFTGVHALVCCTVCTVS